jgi:phage terminase large subunit-like protein
LAVPETLTPSEQLLRAVELLTPPPWEPVDRPPLLRHQLPPKGKWKLWLLEGARGCGKTEACARYFARYMREHPGARGRIIAPTIGDAIEACVRGPSGLLSIDPEIRFTAASGGGKCFWPNGSEALVIGTAAPRDVERLRAAGNRDLDWWEEMAANSQLGPAWDQAALGLRSGRPHSIASTTPRPTDAYRALRGMPGVVRTYATLEDNPHTPPEWRAYMQARFGGTHLGRQELLGELIDDTPGALWTRAMFESRVSAADCRRIVVAVDPAMTSRKSSDDTGIVVAGVGYDGHGYVLADETCHESPDAWAKRVARLQPLAGRLHRHRGQPGRRPRHDRAEGRAREPAGPHRQRQARESKDTRAEPVAVLYEQGRVHHVGLFPQLEDECCQWVEGISDSPDRLDALVWAITSLMLQGPGVVSRPIRIRKTGGSPLREAANQSGFGMRRAG